MLPGKALSQYDMYRAVIRRFFESLCSAHHPNLVHRHRSAPAGHFSGKLMNVHNAINEAEEIRVCQGDIDYRGIVRHINDGVVIIRKGKIVFANHAFFQMSQRTPDQVLKSSFSDFISPADRETVSLYCMQRVFTGENLSDTIEFVMPRRDGDAIIEMKVSVIACGGTRAILGALTDITERRKTRFELQRMKERLESILHSMNEVVVSFSPLDYSIRSINPAAEALYGVPLRDFTSGEKHILMFVHPRDREKVDRFYRDLPESEFSEARYRIISSNGEVKWVLDEGHVVYSSMGSVRRIDHVIRDITEEKKANDALRESEARYRDFFESTSDMAFAITHEGQFLDINDAGLKLLGFESREEALASNVTDFYVDPLEREEFVKEIYERGHIEGRPVKFKSKSGEVIEVAITARVKHDDSGRFLYHEGIVHNISKALEDQRNRVLRNAAGSLCHYLNTHLMHLHSSQGGLAEEMESLEGLVQQLTLGGNPREIADEMKRSLETMRYFQNAAGKAYEKIAEVTRVFNKAFHYREESYLNDTILDIFKAYGYEGDEIPPREPH